MFTCPARLSPAPKQTTHRLPFIYTPTIGAACQSYHRLPVLTTGLYLSLRDRGQILKRLKSWRQQDVRVAVVTGGWHRTVCAQLSCAFAGCPATQKCSRLTLPHTLKNP